MSEIEEIVKNLQLELRRGAMTLCVLSQLKGPKYGYGLVELLEQKGVRIEPGTLYPLLRRLEDQDLLKSEWKTTGSKPRKYYELNDTGKMIYGFLCSEWCDMNDTINQLINEEQ
ncbi:MAG: PadR family transcriptional regulator [Christensenellales bacterium]